MGCSGGSGGSLWCCGDYGVWRLLGEVWRFGLGVAFDLRNATALKALHHKTLRHVWHVWRLICPIYPLRFSDRVIVRSSASPLVGIPVPANGLSTLLLLRDPPE